MSYRLSRNEYADIVFMSAYRALQQTNSFPPSQELEVTQRWPLWETIKISKMIGVKND